MSKLYGKELAASIESQIERYQERIDERAQRIQDGWTDMDDCFLSQRVDERAISECRMQLDILKGDGTMEIRVLVDQNGNVIEPRWVDTRYGTKLVANGVFAASLKALIKKTGWKQETRKVPCWTKFFPGSGGGMCAVYSGNVGITRWHTNMVTGEYIGFDDYCEEESK